MPGQIKNKKFWEFENKGNRVADLRIYGEISKYSWLGEDIVTSSDLARELEELRDIDTLNLCINSPGGSVTEAHAIYNSIKRWKAQNNVRVISHIDGVAASASTYLSMSGDEIWGGLGSAMMIHNVQGGAMGESKDLRYTADRMDKMKESIIDVYKTRSHLSREEISDLMDQAVWMTAEEALEYGFIDKIETYEEVSDEDLNNLFTTEMTNSIKVLPPRVKEIRNNAAATLNKTNQMSPLEEGEGEDMPITLEQVRNEAPEVLEQIRNQAIQEERNRIQELDAIPAHNQAAIDMVNEAKFTKPMSAKDVAYNIMTSTSFKAHQEVNTTKIEQVNSGAGSVQVGITEGMENKNNELEDAINNWRG